MIERPRPRAAPDPEAFAVTLSQRPPPVSRRTSAYDPIIGVDVQGYLITRVISAGAMGVVYEAEHPQLVGQRVAIKVLKPEFKNGKPVTGRFFGEEHAISAITHRNIVEVIFSGVLSSGAEYMMMEFLEGETLRKLIERAGPMGASQSLQICEEILSGLGAAHLAGIVHRDLKPANIMICNQSNDDLMVKVCDFGLARPFDTVADPASLEAARADHESLVSGTPEYMSPEQAMGRSTDGQTDLYSVGVILFELLTGRLPFESGSSSDMLRQHCTLPAPRVSSVVREVIPALDDLVAHLLEKAPAERPHGANATRDRVRTLRRALPDHSWVPPGPPAAPPRLAVTAPCLEAEKPGLFSALRELFLGDPELEFFKR